MKNKILWTLCLFITVQNLSGQNFERIQFNEKNKDEYYLALKPQSGKIIGVLVLLPGYGGKAEENFPETKLFNVAYLNDVLTVSLSEGEKIYPDEQVTDLLNRTLADVVRRYSVLKDQFVIGGFSAGG